jgi:23S rRNA (uracil1939-C5)-methyltransferase
VIAVGEVLSLDVEKPAVGGQMIARSGGRIVLVSGAIPGERVSARIERVSKNVAHARTTAVESASPDRRDGASDLGCGGCLYAHIAYSRQVRLKAEVIADAFGRIAKIDVPVAVSVAPSPDDGYRMRARLHARAFRIGFYREGTHAVCDPRGTRQLLPSTCDALDRLAAGMRSLALDRVDEIEVAENIDASQRVAYLATAAPIDERSLAKLGNASGWTGLSCGSTAWGSSDVVDRLDVLGRSLTLTRHVRAFFQGNRYLLADLATHVAGLVDADSDVIDLYAGVGLFAVAVAGGAERRVLAVEGDRVAAADLERNAALNGVAVRTLHSPVEAFTIPDNDLPQNGRRQTIIVDPPRTGLSPDAAARVIQLRADRIVYVSCDIATLARDARRLVDAGYALTRIDAFDMFPNTPHVETVIVLHRT